MITKQHIERTMRGMKYNPKELEIKKIQSIEILQILD